MVNKSRYVDFRVITCFYSLCSAILVNSINLQIEFQLLLLEMYLGV